MYNKVYLFYYFADWNHKMWETRVLSTDLFTYIYPPDSLLNQSMANATFRHEKFEEKSFCSIVLKSTIQWLSKCENCQIVVIKFHMHICR